VHSDFAGIEQRGHLFLDHRVAGQDAAPAHKLNLQVGYGDITILRIRVPKSPSPLLPGGKAAGL
jgi:hypothetical protein